MNSWPRWAAVVCALALGACSSSEPEPLPPPPTTAAVMEDMPSLAQLERGARLYQEHCAQCHGPEAQGHPDWQTPGVVAAPPLDGTGNDWKRPRAQLVAVILDGAQRDGVPVMPGWKGRLSNADVDDIIAWFQALWPTDVYARWKQAAASGAAKD